MKFNKALLMSGLMLLQSSILFSAEAAAAQTTPSENTEIVPLEELEEQILQRVANKEKFTQAEWPQIENQVASHIFDRRPKPVDYFTQHWGILEQVLEEQRRLARELVDPEDQSKVHEKEQWSPMHFAAYLLTKECWSAREQYGRMREEFHINPARFQFVQDLVKKLHIPLNAKTTYRIENQEGVPVEVTVAVHDDVVNKFGICNQGIWGKESSDLAQEFFNVYKGIHAAGQGEARLSIESALRAYFKDGFLITDFIFMPLRYE